MSRAALSRAKGWCHLHYGPGGGWWRWRCATAGGLPPVCPRCSIRHSSVPPHVLLLSSAMCWHMRIMYLTGRGHSDVRTCSPWQSLSLWHFWPQHTMDNTRGCLAARVAAVPAGPSYARVSDSAPHPIRLTHLELTVRMAVSGLSWIAEAVIL